jgi:hypothetical protein
MSKYGDETMDNENVELNKEDPKDSANFRGQNMKIPLQTFLECFIAPNLSRKAMKKPEPFD